MNMLSTTCITAIIWSEKTLLNLFSLFLFFLFRNNLSSLTQCVLYPIVSELQEEGMNAINLPLSPTPFELLPEDIMLGRWTRSLIIQLMLAQVNNMPLHLPSSCRFLFLTEENEVRTMVDPNSKNDRKLQELMKVCV